MAASVIVSYAATALATRTKDAPRHLTSSMNAEPLLDRPAKTFAEHRLKAIMVENATAALHGAPVTTLDIDFMFRRTPVNLKNN